MRHALLQPDDTSRTPRAAAPDQDSKESRTASIDAVKAVTVITTCEAEGHYEHIYGTRKPSLW